MNNINLKELNTDRLDLRIPTIKEQHRLWEILIEEKVNRYYFSTPNGIFESNGLSKDNIEDVKKARELFMKKLSDWSIQEPRYENKVRRIQAQEDNNGYIWSIFLKGTDTVIGQITCFPKDGFPDDIRDVGWYIDPQYQGKGYATEAAYAMLDFMFNEVGISEIRTSAVEKNLASWKIMEKLGCVQDGTKQSSHVENDQFLTSKTYYMNKEMYLNKRNSIDYRYETKEEARDFHKQRRSFIIVNGEVKYIPEGSPMSHFEYCSSIGMDKETFNKITRGYYLNGYVAFYKDNFIYDDGVIEEALSHINEIASTFNIDNFDVYFGQLPEENFALDYHYGKYEKGIVKRNSKSFKL